MQSSMHWPPFRHGRRCGHTEAAERDQCNRNTWWRCIKKHESLRNSSLTQSSHQSYCSHPLLRVRCQYGTPICPGSLRWWSPRRSPHQPCGSWGCWNSACHHQHWNLPGKRVNKEADITEGLDVYNICSKEADRRSILHVTVTTSQCDLTCAAIPPSPARFPPLLACMPVVHVILLYWNIVKESSPSVMSTTWKVFTCTERNRLG